MIRSAMKTYIKGIADDPNGGYFTDALLNAWIDLAQQQVQKKLIQSGHNWYIKPSETLTVASQSDYVMPSDCLTIHRVEYVVGGTAPNETIVPLKEITLNQKDFLTQALGDPANYYIKKDRFVLMPAPQSANKTLRIWYSPLVADLSADSDSPDVPAQFHEYVAIMAAFNCYIKDDRVPANLMAKKKEYEDMLSEMAERRTLDQPRRINVTRDYDGSVLF